MGGLSKRSSALIGIACAIVCAACVFLYLHEVRDEAEAARAEALARYGGEQVEVCVATRDISAGETIDIASVKTMLWVADLLPADAVRNPDDIIGKQAASRILEGEVVSLKRFESQTFALEVPVGLTAVSVPAKDVQAVGGAIAPGMKVNIFATGDSSTRMIAQEILVLATSTSAAGDDGDASVTWITVAVDPSMVEELVAAAQGTQLYFALPGTEEAVAEAVRDAQAEKGGPAAGEQAEGGSSGAASEGEANGSDGAREGAAEEAAAQESAEPIKKNIDEIVLRQSVVPDERESEGEGE